MMRPICCNTCKTLDERILQINKCVCKVNVSDLQTVSDLWQN